MLRLQDVVIGASRQIACTIVRQDDPFVILPALLCFTLPRNHPMVLLPLLQKLDAEFPDKPLYPSDPALATDAEAFAELERGLTSAGYRCGSGPAPSFSCSSNNSVAVSRVLNDACSLCPSPQRDGASGRKPTAVLSSPRQYDRCLA